MGIVCATLRPPNPRTARATTSAVETSWTAETPSATATAVAAPVTRRRTCAGDDGG